MATSANRAFPAILKFQLSSLSLIQVHIPSWFPSENITCLEKISYFCANVVDDKAKAKQQEPIVALRMSWKWRRQRNSLPVCARNSLCNGTGISNRINQTLNYLQLFLRSMISLGESGSCRRLLPLFRTGPKILLKQSAHVLQLHPSVCQYPHRAASWIYDAAFATVSYVLLLVLSRIYLFSQRYVSVCGWTRRSQQKCRPDDRMTTQVSATCLLSAPIHCRIPDPQQHHGPMYILMLNHSVSAFQEISAC